MGLIVHLPLTGDLHNQGLSDCEAVIPNTVNYVNTGKIGKCCDLEGNRYINTGYGIGEHEELTITMWIKMKSTTERQMIIGGNIGSFRLYIGIRNATYNLAFGSTPWGRTTNATVNTSKWQFIAVTIKDKTCSLYCDGEFVESFTTTSDVAFTQNFCIGDDNYRPNMQVNDFRVYNKCLDELRLKLISQALILHYPMGNVDGVIGGRNLFLGTDVEVSNNDYATRTYIPVIPLVAGEIYTASLCVTPAERVSRFSIFVSSGNYNLGSLYTDGTTDKQVITRTFTAGYFSGRDPSVNIAYARVSVIRFPNDGTVTENSTIHWFKIEKGTQATPYTPAPEDYPDQYENIIYDTSGYQHNGTVTDASRPTWNNESPRYAGSYEFDGTDDCIEYTGGVFPSDEVTVSFWFNRTQAKNQFLLDMRSQNHLGIQWAYLSTENKIQLYTTTASRSYYFDYVVPENEWHHYVIVAENDTATLYVDGVLNSSYPYSNTGVLGEVHIGCRYAGTDGRYLAGSLCDMRYYATALSSDEIMNLYNTSAYIDATGNLISYNIEEVSDNA